MDADDIALPERLAAQLTWMSQNKVEICGTCAQLFGTQSRLNWFPEKNPAICAELVFRNALLRPTIMLRAEIQHAHPYDDSLKTMGDYEHLTRLAHHYPMGNIPMVLHRWRSHDRQNHRVQHSAAMENTSKFRRRYLQVALPQARPEEREALAQLADQTPLASVPALEQAGRWLAHLSETEDRFLQQRMADRWRSACLRSAELGMRVYQVYHKLAPNFKARSVRQPDAVLWMACAIHLKYGSPLSNVLRRVRSFLPTNHGSA